MLRSECAGVKRLSCRDASIQPSQREHPSVRSRAFPLSALIDCTSGHAATCTQAVQYPHMSACGVYISACGDSHTSQTRLFWAVPRSPHSSGRVSPKGPTAFNQPGHEAHQMGLSAGWDRRGRVGGGGAGGHLVIVNIFAPPPPLPLPCRVASPSWETVAGRLELRRPGRGRHMHFPVFHSLTFSISAPHTLGVLKRALCDFGPRRCWMCFSSWSNRGPHFTSVFSYTRPERECDQDNNRQRNLNKDVRNSVGRCNIGL